MPDFILRKSDKSIGEILWTFIQLGIPSNFSHMNEKGFSNKYPLRNLLKGDGKMSRPKPEILLNHTDNKTYKSEQILAAEAIYAVFYEGKPINLRSLNSLVNYPGPKYKKTAHANPGHAFNLAEKLNKLFRTDKFEVFRLTVGEKITESSWDSDDEE